MGVNGVPSTGAKLNSSPLCLIRLPGYAMKAAARDHIQPGHRPTPDFGHDVGDPRQQPSGAASPTSKPAGSLQLTAEAEDRRNGNQIKTRSCQKRYRDRQKASDHVQAFVVARAPSAHTSGLHQLISSYPHPLW